MKQIAIICLFILLCTRAASGATARFAVIGDYGYAGSASELAVANMIKSWNVDFIVTVGDNSYNPGTIDNNIGQYYSDFISDYTGAYGLGSPVNRFFPTIGNHEYSDGLGINAYLSYFTLPGTGAASSNTSGNERYYDFEVGDIMFVVLNSNVEEPSGITSNSAQGAWGRNLLTNVGRNARWRLVTMHHPPYSSSAVHGSTPAMQWPFELWGTDLVLAGHDHTYERVMVDQDQSGDSIPYIVNGLGGRSLYAFSSTIVSGSTVRYSANYGAMLVEENDTLLHISFYSIAGGGTLVDSLTLHAIPGCCRGKTGDVNVDGMVNLADISSLLAYLVGGGWVLPCPAEGDVDANGSTINLADLSSLISYLTNGGFVLPPCR